MSRRPPRLEDLPQVLPLLGSLLQLPQVNQQKDGQQEQKKLRQKKVLFCSEDPTSKDLQPPRIKNFRNPGYTP